MKTFVELWVKLLLIILLMAVVDSFSTGDISGMLFLAGLGWVIIWWENVAKPAQIPPKENGIRIENGELRGYIYEEIPQGTATAF